jgi:hypothetical protein
VYRIGKKFAVLVPLGLILGKNYPLFMLFALFFTSFWYDAAHPYKKQGAVKGF